MPVQPSEGGGVLGAFGRLLYCSVPCEFKSAFGLAESVARLRAATVASVFKALMREVAYGPVSETWVQLRREIPMVRNDFKPFFNGQFEERGDGVYLRGHFRMSLAAQVFMTIWLSITLPFGLVMLAAQPDPWPFSLIGIGMFVFGVALLAFGKWLSRNDIAWLSAVIQGALAVPEHEPQDASAAVPLAESNGPPLVLRIVALLLLVLGALSIWQAASSWPTAPRDISAAPLSWWKGGVAGFFGGWLLILALGVYRRQLWAWRQALVLMALEGVLAVFVANERDHGLANQVVSSVMSLLVIFIWGWWWYAQRVHFVSDAGPPAQLHGPGGTGGAI